VNSPAPSLFVEVPPAKLTAAVRTEKAGRSVAITVRLAGPLTLEIAAGTDAAWLAEVLHALQASGT
jgi:hypothetical protein